MQHATGRVERPGESQEALDGKKVTTDEIDAATKLLDKACQKLRGTSDVPAQRITDLRLPYVNYVN